MHGGLLPHHRSMLLEESAISLEVVLARGYRSVQSKAELEYLGFGRSQRNPPGLLLPIHDPFGKIVSYQFRPDVPREKHGKPIKYETPTGSRMVLDVPPTVKDRIGDPDVPLFITEGIKKGDALASRGLCSVDLMGVWNWRGKNEHGGKTALPEWEDVALNDRETYIVFDSDVMVKPEVSRALVRQKGFLETRGARVAPIYLPAGEGGKKQGVDDYFAAGHDIGDLLALVTPEMRGQTEEDHKSTQSELLITYAGGTGLFHSPDGAAYATVKLDDHEETWPLKSKRFTQHLLRRFYVEQGKAPSAQALTEARGTIEARAMFDGPEKDVFVRVAKHDSGNVYLDLCNDRWEAVEISVSGWRVVASEAVPVKFVRKDNAAALPYPVAGGSIETLRQLLNVRTEEDFRLLVSWLVGAFNPDGPYPVLILQGEQGSAKSTTVRVLRSVVDPAVEPLRAPPRDERDLAIAASGNWTPALDNLSGMRGWLSDALCRLATGGGFATRELFSDDREVIFSAKRPVILNGIDSLGAAGDLRNRSIIVELPPIPPDKRRTEREFYRELEEARPKVLGSLLDAASAALRNRDRVKLQEPPRMADFAVWATAAEEALGWEPGAFGVAYVGNQTEATELALDNDPVAEAIRTLLKERDEWTGTSTQLLNELGHKVAEDVKHSASWPRAANSLTNRLRRLAPALREFGIEYGDDRAPGGSRQRIKRLRKLPGKIVTNVPTVPALEKDPQSDGSVREDLWTIQDSMGRSRDDRLLSTVSSKIAANGRFGDVRDDRDDKKPVLSEDATNCRMGVGDLEQERLDFPEGYAAPEES